MSNVIFADMVSGGTSVIKHPTDIVWPYLLDQAAWMTEEFKLETVAGERNQEGELKKATPFESRFHPFFFKTMLLVPFRRFVYKAYTENRSGKYGFTGIEVLSLGTLGKNTTVNLEAYLEFQSWTMTRQELIDYVNGVREASSAMWGRNFQRLSALIDRGRC